MSTEDPSVHAAAAAAEDALRSTNAQAADLQDLHDEASVDAMLHLAPTLLHSPSGSVAGPISAISYPQASDQFRSRYKAFLASPEHASSPSKKTKRHDTRSKYIARTSRRSLLSPLGRLPVEVLTAVFSHLGPAALVVLAETCSYLRRLLLDNSAKRIWRSARESVLPARVPDPPEGWTEHQFAHVVFGKGVCEMCKTLTNRIPFSFELRVRLCHSPACASQFVKSLVHMPYWYDLLGPNYGTWFSTSVPRLEPTNYRLPRGFYRMYPRPSIRSNWVDILSAYEQDCTTMGLAAARIDWQQRQLHAIRSRNYWNDLVRWVGAHESSQKRVHKVNDALVRRIARAHGWSNRDVFSSQSVVQILRLASLDNRVLDDAQVSRHLSDIAAEVSVLRAARERRAAEASDMLVQEQLASLHQFLLSLRPGPFPSLLEFKMLPSVKGLAVAGKHSDILRKRGSANAIAHLDADLLAWTERSRYEFAKLLPAAYHAEIASECTTAWMHPAERLDALFMCTRCETADKRRYPVVRWRALDCAAACQHICPGAAASAEGLRANTFAWDEDASRAATAAMLACGASPASCTGTDIASIGGLFRCCVQQCELTMPFDRVAAHALRHVQEVGGRIDFDYVETSAPRGTPVSFKTLLDAAGRARQDKIVMCRHCARKCGSLEAMQSHIHAKHRVARVHLGEEDFRDPPSTDAVCSACGVVHD